MKVVFITPFLSQPRCVKRVTAFLNAGYDCSVFGYERGNYDVNKYPDSIPVTNLGRLKDGSNYISKFKKAFWDIRDIIQRNQGNDVFFYSFSFQHTIMLKAMKVKYIYEISDILYAYPHLMPFLPIFKVLDKNLIKHSTMTVMTSGGFYNFFNLKDDKIVVIPNKVNPALMNYCCRETLHLENGIRFAFIGSIRYESVFRIADVIGENFKQHSFTFWGSCRPYEKEKVDELLSKYSNIYYKGVFKSPEDLPNIYKNVDIVIACYDINSLNERLAEPNKLYEALCFCKPIIVSKGIFLGDRVKQLKCGYAIDASTKGNIKDFISSLSFNEIKKISNMELSLNQNEFVDRTNDLLISRLKEL